MAKTRDPKHVMRHGVEHAGDCSCKVVHHFKCNVCERRVGWCLGCHDDMPKACDFCWVEAHHAA